MQSLELDWDLGTPLDMYIISSISAEIHGLPWQEEWAPSSDAIASRVSPELIAEITERVTERVKKEGIHHMLRGSEPC